MSSDTRVHEAFYPARCDSPGDGGAVVQFRSEVERRSCGGAPADRRSRKSLGHIEGTHHSRKLSSCNCNVLEACDDTERKILDMKKFGAEKRYT